jgi:hypothetical protein
MQETKQNEPLLTQTSFARQSENMSEHERRAAQESLVLLRQAILRQERAFKTIIYAILLLLMIIIFAVALFADAKAASDF